MTARALSVIAAGLALSVTSCSASVSVGGKSIDKDALQSEVQSQLSKTVGLEAPPVTCPGGLEATVDATTTCTMSDGDATYNVAVKVTSVDEGTGTAKFDIHVADKPNP